ncbi:hypothetical protein ACNHYB_14610 [Isoptericola jiangsuensis]|uniref:hypothetical protein n=1 Tax=Isoptericola jiangsuensis TaxID=548579 RepID=UPI003AADA503
MNTKRAGIPAGVLAVLLLAGCTGEDGEATGAPSVTSQADAAGGASPESSGEASTSEDGQPKDGQSEDDGSSAAPEDVSGEEVVEPSGEVAETAQPSKDGKQEPLFNRVPGDESGKCLKVGDERDVRSGGIVGGSFDDARKSWDVEQPGKPSGTARLYWIPMDASEMPGVEVVATNKKTGDKVVTDQDLVSDAEQWRYYDTYIALPAAGEWTFEVTAGEDTGCFVVKLT